jgi:hypothetical protein
MGLRQSHWLVPLIAQTSPFGGFFHSGFNHANSRFFTAPWTDHKLFSHSGFLHSRLKLNGGGHALFISRIFYFSIAA